MSVVDISSRDLANKILIECLNNRRDPLARQVVTQLLEQNKIEWEALWDMAVAERIAPLLYHATRDMGWLPPAMLERCHAEYVDTGVQNTLRLREVASILSALSEAGIPVITLKGVALIERIYGNLGLRPMMDVDLLVERKNVSAALAVLEQCGYRQVEMEIAAGALLAYENEMLLQKQDPWGWSLELHWSLFDSPFHQERLTEDKIWAAAEPLMVEQVPTLALSTEWTVLHMCGHLALHHRGIGLLWWNDLAEMISQRKDDIKWEDIFELARTNHLVMPLKEIIPQSVATWRSPVPTRIMTQLSSIVPAREEARYYAMITQGNHPPGRRFLNDLAAIGPPRDKARFAFRNIFPTTQYMEARYHIKHPFLRVFYYLYRWYLGISHLFRSRNGR